MNEQMPEVNFTDEELDGVRRLLAAHVEEEMPDDVQQRLDEVLAAEVTRREDAARRSAENDRASELKSNVGTFGQHPEFDRSWNPHQDRVR